MLRFHFVDYVKTTLATNNLVVGADLFNTCTYFHGTDHAPSSDDSLLMFDKIVRLELPQHSAINGHQKRPVRMHRTVKVQPLR